MAHCVETMFSVRERPWHGLGRIVTEAPDSEQALIVAGLNWGVHQDDVYVNGAVAEGFKANVRSTDNKVLGIVGKLYRPFQNREAFNFMDGLLGDGAVYETAGSLSEGRSVWMLARLPEQYKLAGDPSETYLLVSNSHDGSTAVRAAVVPVRVVCRNTLNLALSRAYRTWTVRHSGDMTSKVQAAQQALGMTRKYMQELVSLSDMLKEMQLASDTWTDVVNQLLPIREANKTASAGQRQKERQEALWQRMMVEDLADHRWTVWGAINAVADYADHAAPARETETSRESRFKQISNGHPLVDKAMDILVPAKIRKQAAASLM